MAGYIGTTPVPQATQNREAFTAVSTQTTFNTSGYTPGFLDVYLNGVKLAAADFTATNGSDVVLASGAAAGDILEVVSFTAFEILNQSFSGTTTMVNASVTGAFTSQGIDDNADAVAITIDSSENVGIGTPSPSMALDVAGACNTGGQTGAYVLQTLYDTTAFALGVGGGIGFAGNAGPSTSDVTFATINGIKENSTTGNYSGALTFKTRVSGAALTEAMRISSDGSVGINDSNPDGKLNVVSTAHNNGSIFDSTGTTQLWLRDTDASSNQKNWGFQVSGGSLNILRANDDRASGFVTPIEIKQAPANSLVIDASGNLLVGKTSSSFSTEGSQLNSNGSVDITKSGGAALFVNRLSSDGDIAKFYKDGTTVGSIGTSTNTEITLAGQDAGIGIIDYALVPTRGQGVLYRNSTEVDLGRNDTLFKDLYLSGGIQFDSRSNKLDDYEEGTWTPTISSGTVTAENAWYVKVGTLITISAKFSGFSDTSSGSSVTVGGVPFTTKASDHTAQGSMIAEYLNNGPYFPYISSNATTIRFYIQSTSNYTTMVHSNLGSSGSFYFTLTYQTQ